MILLRYFRNLNGLLFLHSKDINGIQKIIDIITISGTFCFFSNKELSVSNFIIQLLLLLIISIIIFNLGGIYKSFRKRSLYNLTGRLFISWLIIIFIFNNFINKDSVKYSNSFEIFDLWTIYALCILFASHVLLRFLLRKYRIQGGNKRNIIFWGMSNEYKLLVKNLEENPWLGYRVVKWFSPEKLKSKEIDSNMLSSFGGDLNNLTEWIRSNTIDEIIFSDIDENIVSLKEVLMIFGDTYFPVSYFPKWTLNNMNLKINKIGNKFHINIWSNNQSLLEKKLKRFFDFFLSLTAIVLLSPIFTLIAILIKIDSPGPIIFKQIRYGLDSKKFLIYKFRSMNTSHENDNKVIQAKKNDPRITLIGKFIRKWSLDELPQLFNVLEGSMSIVGPRPHALEHNEQYRKIIPGYMQRCSVKPGITGLAQINGLRGETPNIKDMEKRIEADIQYQNEWSLKLDIKIIIMTIFTINSKKAY